jgi:hypothetical protein
VFSGTIGDTVGSETTHDGFDDMTLGLFVRIAVEEAIHTTCSESSCCDALTFGTSPWAWFVAASDCFDDSSNYSGFGRLLPLFAIVATTTASASVLAAI